MAYTAVARTALGVGGTRIDNISTATGVAGGAGTGYKFSNPGGNRLYVNNTGVGTPNVVVLASGTFKGVPLTANDQTLAVVASAQHGMGPFDTDIYNDSGGFIRVYFTGGDETDLELVWL